MEILKYQSFEGSAELDMDRQECHGKILYIDDVVTYRASDPKALVVEFRAAVDDYLETCAAIGKEPEKSCRGLFNVRVNPELHRAALRRAGHDGATLNTVVCRALETYLFPRAEPTRVKPAVVGAVATTASHWDRVHACVQRVGFANRIPQHDLPDALVRIWEPQSSSATATEINFPTDVSSVNPENNRVH